MPALRGRLGTFAGLAVSAVLLWYALHGIDTHKLLQALREIDFVSVLVCGAMVALGILVRSVRWRLIAAQAPATHASFFRATQLGVLSNLVFPGRLGEVVRIVALKQSMRLTLPLPLASALIDRMVDVLVLGACALPLLAWFPVSAVLEGWLSIFAIVALIMLALLALLGSNWGWGDRLIAWIARRLSKRWPVEPELFFLQVRLELQTMSRQWLRWKLLVVSLLVLCLDCGVFVALLQAFHQTLPLSAPLVLWVFLSAGSALPSAPGYVGVYQVAAVWALSMFNVPPETAVALATVLQLVSLATALLLAGPGALRWLRRSFARGIN
ncbi:MAG: hypothetical protein JWM47_4211 [Acidimicrobiales bacterium]|nr:hypothetical protein [Acidimicrobiales bacterium]